jgi:DNA-binding transcriptional MocR family regulator
MSLRAPPMSVFAQVPHLRAEIGRRTVRERISDKLASLIASGILQIGEELPSERDLAALLAVSRETVRGAIQTLAAIGVVAVSQGSRTRVVSRKIDTLKIGVASPSAINFYELDSVHKARVLIERSVAAESGRPHRRVDALPPRTVARDPEANDARFPLSRRPFADAQESGSEVAPEHDGVAGMQETWRFSGGQPSFWATLG